MAKRKKRLRILIIFLIFLVYFLIAARPIPREPVLVPGWVSSLDSESPVLINNSKTIQSTRTNARLPFTLGNHFGYIDYQGNFIINRVKTGDIYLCDFMWTEYEAEPSIIEIKDIEQKTIITIENVSGYPILLDNRIFIIGSQMNTLSEINKGGNILWTYEFGGLLTCIDAAAGLVITGSIDGVVEILNSYGERVFYFVPGGSRLEVIYGCAISGNGSRLGIISGIDQQRFLLLERIGNTGPDEYRVIYHEFAESGFRRPVHISFIDEDRRIVYERDGGIGCYNIRSRRAFYIPLDGQITAIENTGSDGVFFLITSNNFRNELVGIKFPPDFRFAFSGYDPRDAIFLKAQYKSGDVFLGRTPDKMLITGGGGALISFTLEEK